MATKNSIFIILLIFTAPAYSMAPGDLDSSFNPTGPLPGTQITDVTGIGGLSEAVGVNVQQDGKIVASGFGRISGILRMATDRYNTDGTLDMTFGTNGIVLETAATLPGSNSYAYDVEIQPDGKIVVSGYSSPSTLHFTTIRYTTTGGRDGTFGVNGAVILPNFFVGGNDVTLASALQQDGKIVVGGVASQSTTVFGFGLARYNTDGSLDTNFNNVGTLYIPIDSPSQAELQDLVLQPNQKIVATGFFTNSTTSRNDAAVIRINTDGTLDTTFNGNGMTTFSFPDADVLPIAIALQSDGKILIAGQIRLDASGAETQIILDRFAAFFNSSDPSNLKNVFVARFNCDGSIDTTFGIDGFIINSVGTSDSLANDITVQSNSKIVIVGEAQQGTTVVLLITYNPNGTYDTAFNPLAPNPGEQPGVVLTNISTGQDVGNSIYITPDKKLAISGFSAAEFLAARYIADNQQVPPGTYSPISNAILQKYCQSGCS